MENELEARVQRKINNLQEQINTIRTATDITFTTPGRGIIIRSLDGLVVRRLRLNDAGTDIILEAVS